MQKTKIISLGAFKKYVRSRFPNFEPPPTSPLPPIIYMSKLKKFGPILDN